MDAQLHPFVAVISHCHPDHIGGCTDSSGRLLYSNARFVLAQDEWDSWSSESNLAKLDDFFADAVLHPIHIERPEWIAVVDMDKEGMS